MRTTHLIVAAVLVVASTIACDPTAALTQTPLFGELRDDLIAECCNCLSDKWIIPESESGVCPDGTPGIPSRCLCGSDAATCREQLSAEKTVTLLGACVYDEARFDGGTVEPGPCADACRGVLAFPEE